MMTKTILYILSCVTMIFFCIFYRFYRIKIRYVVLLFGSPRTSSVIKYKLEALPKQYKTDTNRVKTFAYLGPIQWNIALQVMFCTAILYCLHTCTYSLE